MRIKELAVHNFRNYVSGRADFAPGVNVLSGGNGMGKTNLLEAAMLCCIGRSPRTPRDKDMIRHGESGAHISLKVEKSDGETSVDIYLSDRENKRILINGMPIMRIGELMGAVNCVFFSPDELRIVKDGPEGRRRFLDIDISQMSKTYFYMLSRYNQILSQRNKLLKTAGALLLGAEKKGILRSQSRLSAQDDNNSTLHTPHSTLDIESLRATLPVWNEQLADAGAKIIVSRRRFIEKLKPHAAKAHLSLTDGKEEMLVEYECGVSSAQCTVHSAQEKLGVRSEELGVNDKALKEKNQSFSLLTSHFSLKEAMLAELIRTEKRDLKNGYTGAGPHKDDFSLIIKPVQVSGIKAQGTGIDARVFGSQGQQRTAALALKLAELEIFAEEIGEYPVLLLDDVMSELDKDRQQRLVEHIKNAQTVLTCTHLEIPVAAARHYAVKNGVLHRI